MVTLSFYPHKVVRDVVLVLVHLVLGLVIESVEGKWL